LIKSRTDGIYLLLLASLLFLAIGWLMERILDVSMLDFKGVYYSASCLLHGDDPYKPGEVLRFYQLSAADHSSDPEVVRQVLAQYFYLPNAFAITAPVAFLAFGPAHLVWMALNAASLILAAVLIWEVGEKYAPLLSASLIGLLLATSGSVLAIGNAAGMAVGLCVVGAWCFLRQRWIVAGVLCMAISLTVKPHDSFLVWLYFLLANSACRRRAIQTIALTALLGLPGILWVSHVAPNWSQELRSSMAANSEAGGLSDTGSASDAGRVSDSVVNLQSDFSVFFDNRRVVDWATYLVCAPLFLIWAVTTLRSRFSPENAWFALAAIAALSMLPVYHRQHDAKILFLTVPACVMLFVEGGPIGWFALLATIVIFALVGDLSVFRVLLVRKLPVFGTGLLGKMMTVAFIRPVPLVLLVICVFYVWIYLRRTREAASLDSESQIDAPMQLGTP
jgi:hypothetical protein